MLNKILFLLQILGVPLILLAILHLPFWIIAKKKDKITKLDYTYPFFSILSWVFLSSLFDALNISPKSLSNVGVELLAVIIIAFIGYIVKVLIPFRKEKKIKAILILYYATFGLVLLLTLFMPLLPE